MAAGKTHKKNVSKEMLNLIDYAGELQGALSELYDMEEEIRELTSVPEQTPEAGEGATVLSDADRRELALAAASEERLRLAERAAEGLEMLERAVQGDAAMDPACGAAAMQFLAVVKGAALCVYKATDGMRSRTKAKKLNTAARQTAEKAEKKAAIVYERVLKGITGL